MVFSSVTFLFVFLPITAAVYFLPSLFLRPEKTIIYKNASLFAASLFFYAWGEPVYVLLMLVSILFNFYLALDIDAHIDQRKHKRFLLICGIVFNLGSLAFFKYSGLIAQSIGIITGADTGFDSPALPVGISFYTFQILSYIIDVYRNDAKAQKKLVNFALYISMFPQLIAGPIVQYSTIEKQLSSRTENLESAADGIRLFIIGLSKKVILANAAGAICAEMESQGVMTSTVLGSWSAMLFYAFQIYYDFSGYSDMAIGLGKIFGFEFPQNFNHPYVADSVTDFWRRWHISLSSWFRDYLYIPLGGNRRSTPRNIFNLLIVWLLTGLWHGASWNFVLWGLYYGVLLLLEKYVLAGAIRRIPKNLRRILTFIAVLIGWVLFSSESMGRAISVFSAMIGAGGGGFLDNNALYYLSTNIVLLAMMAVFASPLFTIKPKPESKRTRFILFIASLVLYISSAACLISETYNPFLYFRF